MRAMCFVLYPAVYSDPISLYKTGTNKSPRFFVKTGLGLIYVEIIIMLKDGNTYNV